MISHYKFQVLDAYDEAIFNYKMFVSAKYFFI